MLRQPSCPFLADLARVVAVARTPLACAGGIIAPNVSHDTARRLTCFFEADAHGASAVYLCGSVAREEATSGSDIDVGVLFADLPASTFDAQPYGLEGDLERYLGGRVDLVSLNGAPVDLRARVLRDGLLVFEGDRAAPVRFDVRMRNEAFDLEPILRACRAPREAAR